MFNDDGLFSNVHPFLFTLYSFTTTRGAKPLATKGYPEVSAAMQQSHHICGQI